MILNELLNEWLYEHQKRNIKLSTFNNYKQKINSRISYSKLGKSDIKSIQKKDIESYIAFLLNDKTANTKKKRLEPRTINSEIKILYAAFEYAKQVGYVETNPVCNIKKIKVPKADIRTQCFHLEQQRKLENYCLKSNNPNYYAVIIALYTGIRIGELLGLTWDNYDSDAKILHITNNANYTCNYQGERYKFLSTPKTESSIRDIPLSPKVNYLLQKIHEINKHCDFIFSNSHGEMRTVNDFEKIYRKLINELNIPKLSFHKLRHTFATRALESGVDPKTLADILGHSRASTTLKIYGHSTTKQKHISINKIERLVNPYDCL